MSGDFDESMWNRENCDRIALEHGKWWRARWWDGENTIGVVLAVGVAVLYVVGWRFVLPTSELAAAWLVAYCVFWMGYMLGHCGGSHQGFKEGACREARRLTVR